ncbi:molecular chaperone HscC [Rhizobiales bacterium GAS191]|nr:molecular chaperone HscC [Rhizobiales bacterium GAS191]SED10758.1 molecular chaperone HscC [Rhizobiales bacterium GAS188]
MILGIDLGTTNSLVGLWRNGAPELIPNALGSPLTPSAVSIDDDGSVLIGMSARERLSTHPGRSVAAFKRSMGTQQIFRVGRQAFRAEELSALVLRQLREDAERYLNQPVVDAIVTVPAYFGDAQRKATRAAGQLAGLNVVRLLNEPTAAALAYGLHESRAEQRILVLDLGGGTFDVSILELFEGVMEVRATAGDNFLGGEDFVDAIMDGFIAAVGEEAGIAPRSRNLPVHAALRRAGEVAKRALTNAHEHEIVLNHNSREWRWGITREILEQLSAPLLSRLRAPIERALRDAKLMPEEIGNLVLAGGATRMPLFRGLATRLFRRLPFATVNPDEVVARGAAVQAGLMARDAALEDRVMTDVAPFTMGIEVVHSQERQIFATGLYLPVIERNTTIPASRAVTVQTVQDRQRRIDVRVFQGEARLVANNIHLGELRLAVPPAPAGTQSIEIRFTYDTSGLLEVETHVEATGSTQHLVIENQPGVLTSEEIEQRLAALAHLKIHPREQAESRALLSRAERLYSERLGEERERIAGLLDHFRMLLERQDPTEIAAYRTELAASLDAIDTSFFD